MEISFSEKSQQFKAGIFAVLNEKKMELARQGRTIYNLSVGTPDFETPAHIREAVSEAAKDQLAKEGYDPKYGARPLRKTIQKRLEDPLADMFLMGKFKKAEKVTVGYRKESFTFDVKERKEDE